MLHSQHSLCKDIPAVRGIGTAAGERKKRKSGLKAFTNWEKTGTLASHEQTVQRYIETEVQTKRKRNGTRSGAVSWWYQGDHDG